jgi:hypothetical protein
MASTAHGYSNGDGRGLGVQLARLCGSFDHQPSERRLLSARDERSAAPRCLLGYLVLARLSQEE